MRIASLCLVALTLAACGGDDDSSAFEGIYTVDSWTSNPDGCDAEGPPAFEASNYTHFYIRFEDFLGESFLNLVACEDLETCRSKAADTDTLSFGSGFFFEEGNDEDGWTNTSAFVFNLGEAETCEGTVGKATLIGEEGGSVRVEEESVTVTDVPLDGDECDDEAAKEQAEPKPCEELTVVTGSYLEDI
jgi:hypothetical protein